ncbi:hypothetical protein BDZ45DRAFT_811247 [Acephala macrosclerotiorum]|nr:hypothetical protein BDZ45DRAFT_811247 [Acephala macrosclerotiorum]
MSIENEPGHVHSAACFIDIQPLSVAELFQYQGCAACPPAVPGIQSAAMGPSLLLLNTTSRISTTQDGPTPSVLDNGIIVRELMLRNREGIMSLLRRCTHFPPSIPFDFKQQTVKVGKGPNKGKIVYGNLVKGIHKLGG